MRRCPSLRHWRTTVVHPSTHDAPRHNPGDAIRETLSARRRLSLPQRMPPLRLAVVSRASLRLSAPRAGCTTPRHVWHTAPGTADRASFVAACSWYTTRRRCIMLGGSGHSCTRTDASQACRGTGTPCHDAFDGAARSTPAAIARRAWARHVRGTAVGIGTVSDGVHRSPYREPCMILARSCACSGTSRWPRDCCADAEA